jgi:hypothetical protein
MRSTSSWSRCEHGGAAWAWWAGAMKAAYADVLDNNNTRTFVFKETSTACKFHVLASGH